MRFIGDFHIHSHYSIATSKKLVPEYLDRYARIKGITVVGTGDFTHPGWLSELGEKLEPAEEGLYVLKEEAGDKILDPPLPPQARTKKTRFLLTAEISSIYKRDGRVRKVHNLLFVPDFESARKIQDRLERVGNIRSDGRPILGIDSRDLLELALEAAPRAFFVPAHIWTPWFSALGHKSGFESIRACYRDMTPYIHAIETGLSSDPPMNWICSFLDPFTIISNSDAHSPEKLGREANLFDADLSYGGLTGALSGGKQAGFRGTVEFFPQEGKYHYDGHRKCGVRWDPLQTVRNDGICPVCGKKVTVGVMNRVARLADRDNPLSRENRSPYYSLIPLKEILSELCGTGPSSKKVGLEYNALIMKAGSEFDLLLNLPEEEVEKLGGEMVGAAVSRMRRREVVIEEGFDGEFGKICLFPEKSAASAGPSLFTPVKNGAGDTAGSPVYSSGAAATSASAEADPVRLIRFNLGEYKRLSGFGCSSGGREGSSEPKGSPGTGRKAHSLNSKQLEAVHHPGGPALIIAGPGTGKTMTLTFRIAHIIDRCGVNPGSILALTFTNKAAQAITQRLEKTLGEKAKDVRACTFHRFGLSVLEESCGTMKGLGRPRPGFTIIDSRDREALLAESGHDADTYAAYKEKHNIVDLDDLLLLPLELFNDGRMLATYRSRFTHLLVDEYQDINEAQYRIVRKLMPGEDADICVIGDPNQAIYGFRGSDVRFIERFTDDYPKSAVYTLARCYRCTDRILKASRQVVSSAVPLKGTGPGIRSNAALLQGTGPGIRSNATMLQGTGPGIRIQISEHPTERSEAEFVARTIESMIGGLRFFSMDSSITEGQKNGEIESLSDFAVLCRTALQMGPVEKALKDHAVPYNRIGESHSGPAGKIIDVLRIIRGPDNPYLLGKAGKLGIKKKGIEELRLLAGKISLQDLMDRIAGEYFPGSLEDAVLRKLCSAGTRSTSLGTFITDAALRTVHDLYEPGTENVSLMTLHAAKGLEFSCVFIVGCEEGLIPYTLSGKENDLEEERRLFYVGMTRAKNDLFLTGARSRRIFGRMRRREKSPFIKQIEEELVEIRHSAYQRKPNKSGLQFDLFDEFTGK